jgi:hypothetical protein
LRARAAINESVTCTSDWLIKGFRGEPTDSTTSHLTASTEIECVHTRERTKCVEHLRHTPPARHAGQTQSLQTLAFKTSKIDREKHPPQMSERESANLR